MQSLTVIEASVSAAIQRFQAGPASAASSAEDSIARLQLQQLCEVLQSRLLVPEPPAFPSPSLRFPARSPAGLPAVSERSYVQKEHRVILARGVWLPPTGGLLACESTAMECEEADVCS